MHNFVIITDMASDMTRDLRERFGVEDYVHGVLVFPDGHSELSDLDWGNITPEEYYGSMKDKKALYSTSLPSPQEFGELFERYLKQGRDVLFVSIASGLSGTYSVSCTVAGELREKYPERKIRCVDSLRYCGAEALLLTKASELRAAGKTLDETADWLEANRLRVHQMGVLEDLFFCKRMGRVSGAAAVMGTLVGIRPLADLGETGLSTPIGKVRGRKTAIDTSIEYIRRTIENPEEQIIFVTHSVREEQALELKRRIEEEFHPREVIVTTVCQACGASIGPGLYVAFYLGKPVSKGLTEERKILAELTGK